VHRDLQPRNVLVSRDGGVKLTSFAAAMDERLPTAPELLEGGAGFGTPAYMSPEQLLGEPEDPRSDLFALGIVLHEMLTGKRPFDASSERASSHRVRHDPVPPLARAVPEISPGLDRLVRRCLEKMPSDRAGSAEEVRRGLAAELAELGFQDPKPALLAELSRLGLARVEPALAARPGAEGTKRVRARARPATVQTALLGHLVALALLVAGGVAIQLGAARAEGDRSQGGGVKLELVPARAGYLRVVAEPWAHVIVDGEPIDTTPFAQPIPLPAGVHYVRLEHPAAPTERRTVTLSQGETVLLDVKMDVRTPKVSSLPPKPQDLTDPTTP
jgi:serine/threonine-protein kinase